MYSVRIEVVKQHYATRVCELFLDLYIFFRQLTLQIKQSKLELLQLLIGVTSLNDSFICKILFGISFGTNSNLTQCSIFFMTLSHQISQAYLFL